MASVLMIFARKHLLIQHRPPLLGCAIAGRALFCPFLGPRMKLGVGTPQGHDCLTKQGKEGFLPRS